MSKSVEKASEGEPEEPKNDFVLDFLYNDARRVGSFLAQFNNSGHLQRVIERESATKGQKRGFKVNLGGGGMIVGTGGTGTIGIERGPGETGSEGLELEYDPLWANALTLLDYLTIQDMISSDLRAAGIGQFVKVTGSLRIHDLSILKTMWDIPAVRRQMGHEQQQQPRGNRKQRRASSNAQETKQPPDAIELGIEVMKTLPHAITARTTSEDGHEIWSSLQAASLTGSTSDLFLKHGANIAGTWNMIGVLDAEPNLTEVPQKLSEEENSAQFLHNGFSHILNVMGPLARMFLGRPAHAYGVTPLVIYREVAR